MLVLHLVVGILVDMVVVWLTLVVVWVVLVGGVLVDGWGVTMGEVGRRRK